MSKPQRTIFYARIESENLPLFKKNIELAQTFVNDANLFLDSSTISICAPDPSNISFVDVKLKIFSSARGFPDNGVVIALNIKSLSKIFSRADNGDAVEISQEDPDFLNFTFTSSPSNTVPRISELSLALLDIEVSNYELSNENYECHIKMPSADFLSVIKNLAHFSNTIAIRWPTSSTAAAVAAAAARNVQVEFSAENASLGKGRIVMKEGKDVEINVASPTEDDDGEGIDGGGDDEDDGGGDEAGDEDGGGGSASNSYSLSMVESFAKQTCANKLDIYIGCVTPLVLIYDYGLKGHARFFLANRIVNN